MPRFPIAAVLLAFLLAGCGGAVQTTSGAAYLAEYPATEAFAPTAEIDRAVREAASVEPILLFPARFGLARIENGRLTPIPQAEADAWSALTARLGADYGEFVPISPLVVEMVAPEDRPRTPDVRSILRDLRLGAARQHVDAVLVYEVFATADARANPLAVADLTIIGGFLLPGRSVDAVGYANALLVDVRNGYPYLTANAAIDKRSLSTGAMARGTARDLMRRASAEATVRLTGELADLLPRLRLEMAEKRLAAQ